MRFDRKFGILASFCSVLFLAAVVTGWASGQTTSQNSPTAATVPETQYTSKVELNGVTLSVPMSWFISNQYERGAVVRTVAAQQRSNIFIFSGQIPVPSAGPLLDLHIAAQPIAPGNTINSISDNPGVLRFTDYTVGSPHQEFWYIPAHNVIIKVRYETVEEKELIGRIFSTVTLDTQPAFDSEA